jgi:UDP-N-acetylmuramyl pentapeptide phosphotransferase/UDP-N-acetylglucosamine-1-phosphate transferase
MHTPAANGFWDDKLMPCLLLLIILAFPRVVLALMFLLSNYLDRAYHGLLLPLLGFLFLPLTTIVYAWLVNSHRSLDGVNLLILIVAVIVDAGGLGGGEWHRRRR